MDIEAERLFKIIYSNGIPENLEHSELLDYLLKLSTYKVENIKREQFRLTEETKAFVEKTEDLAISNFKTFIHTAGNTRSIFQEFLHAESQVNNVFKKLPRVIASCEVFLEKSADINEARRVNTITLKKNPQLLEILEIPQLMERCIRDGRYEDSLDLAGFVQKLCKNKGRIRVLHSIVKSVETLWHTMLVQLVEQLRTDLQLPKCLQIVGYLRQMQAFDNKEMKVQFLQARGAWLTASLDAIPRDNVQHHISKTIEVTRINLFNIITQYRAIFPEENMPVTVNSKAIQKAYDDRNLLLSWLHLTIARFLQTLEEDLHSGGCSFDTVLGQCMYFGLSLSRVGTDFRALMTTIFVSAINKNFRNLIANAQIAFERLLENCKLLNCVTFYEKTLDASNISARVTTEETLAPPESLLNFLPLAALCNGYLAAFNELRLCAPVALADDITRCVQQSLEAAASRILSFYRHEQQAFSAIERDCFIKFCSCFAYDLIPYMQRCICAIFPQQNLTTCLCITSLTREEKKFTYLEEQPILDSLRHVLPELA